MVANMILRRLLSTQRNDIGQIFIQENVQKILKDITRFEEGKVFAKRRVPQLNTPKLVFMSDEQLKKAKEEAYENVKARLQMPPVMTAKTDPPRVLAKDEDIVGYTKFTIMFIDISQGISDRKRLMSVREPDGTLREPTFEERSRLNHMFYADESRTIDPPKLFEENNLARLLKNKEYVYVLNLACAQFEPDDPRYVNISNKVYSYINDKGHHNMLRSTRHFGPMSLYLAYTKQIDDLLVEMISKSLIEDAAKLVKLHHVCHDIEFEDNQDNLAILKSYAEDHSAKKYNLDLVLQKLSNQG